jgi:quercetin dioxygenase-like cupin family protein
MKTAKLNGMIKGWFMGDFSPSIVRAESAEAAVKSYNKGDYEKKHYHKIACEITVIAKGKARMNGVEYGEGDIILIEPGEAADFECQEDGTLTMVVKMPSIAGDKYEAHPE